MRQRWGSGAGTISTLDVGSAYGEWAPFCWRGYSRVQFVSFFQWLHSGCERLGPEGCRGRAQGRRSSHLLFCPLLAVLAGTLAAAAAAVGGQDAPAGIKGTQQAGGEDDACSSSTGRDMVG